MNAGITAVRIGSQRIVLTEAVAVVPVEFELADASTAEVQLTAPLTASDLVVGEKVLQKPEVVVCGAIVKPIKRTDAEFATFVRNENSDIVFQNEEGTSAAA